MSDTYLAVSNAVLYLFLNGEFNDYQKIQYIEELCGDKEHMMFNSLLESDKYDKEH